MKEDIADIDIIVDLQRGDCGKGKVAKALAEKGTYSAVCKYSGGGNSGHTVWVGKKKYVAHYLTSGIYKKDCYVFIGPGAVVDPYALKEEIEFFEREIGLDKNMVKVFPNTHIVTKKHLEEDGKDNKIGTTRKGVGPAMRDKYGRVGIRMKDWVVDHPEFLSLMGDFTQINGKYLKVLMEGSQGIWLDIDHGDYPYVTSSHIHPLHALTTFGLSVAHLRTIYGIAKGYETYSGFNDRAMIVEENGKPLYDIHDPILNKIREEGYEYGATTGRPRHVGFLNLDRLCQAVLITGIDYLIMNKMDILEKVGCFKLIHHNKLIELSGIERFKTYIAWHLSVVFRRHSRNYESYKWLIFSGVADGSDLNIDPNNA